MADQATIQARIDEIDATLRSGATSVNVDGISVTFNPDALRRERKELEKQLPGNIRRPTVFRNKLG